MKTKICTRCNNRKLLSEFYKSERYKGGHTTWCKTCYSDYGSTHRKVNSEKERARHKVYYRINRKKEIKRVTAWHKAHPEKARVATASYRKAHPEKVKAYIVMYRRAMIGRHTCLLSRHKRYLQLRGCTGTPMSLEEHRMKLYFKDGRERVCYYCHHTNNKTGAGLDRLDSDITYTVENSVPCCHGCNSWKSNKHSVQETLKHFKPMRDAVRNRKGNLGD